MIAPTVLWPALLGIVFLAVGIVTYRRDIAGASPREAFGLVAFGPALVAASLAAFAGEHFTATASLAQLVPKWLPGRLFIAYLVGAAHFAAASSFATRRYVRWAAFFLAVMFALFALLMDLPAAITHPGVRIAWSLAARQATFSIGALALFATVTKDRWPNSSNVLAAIARLWTAGVLVFYGIEHVLYPRFAPGVPSMAPTAAWVPAPTAIAIATGILLIGFGLAMLAERYASAAAAACGALMVLLTLALYVPQFFIARTVPQHVVAINFVFDTLLFGGTMLVISRAIADTTRRNIAEPGRVGQVVPPQRPRSYSDLNASIGFTLLARRAGR